MNKLKDFFYNKNDIIVVLLILAAAAFVIYDRTEIVMNYPQLYAEEIEQQQEAIAAKNVEFTIAKNDTLADVSTNLEKAGVVKSGKAFTEYVEGQKKSGALKAGKYTLIKDSTDEDVLKALTE